MLQISSMGSFHAWHYDPISADSAFPDIPSPFYKARFGVEIFVELQTLRFHHQSLHNFYRDTLPSASVLLLWLPDYFVSMMLRWEMCSSRKYPYPPQGRLMEIPRRRGVSKAQFFKGKYGTKMEFPKGVGGSS